MITSTVYSLYEMTLAYDIASMNSAISVAQLLAFLLVCGWKAQVQHRHALSRLVTLNLLLGSF